MKINNNFLNSSKLPSSRKGESLSVKKILKKSQKK